jgi:hypothetical protein
MVEVRVVGVGNTVPTLDWIAAAATTVVQCPVVTVRQVA